MTNLICPACRHTFDFDITNEERICPACRHGFTVSSFRKYESVTNYTSYTFVDWWPFTFLKEENKFDD